jgi:hypothetical protein
MMFYGTKWALSLSNDLILCIIATVDLKAFSASVIFTLVPHYRKPPL